MDGWMGGWMGGWMDGWVGGWVDGWMGELMEEAIYGLIDESLLCLSTYGDVMRCLPQLSRNLNMHYLGFIRDIYCIFTQ